MRGNKVILLLEAGLLFLLLYWKFQHAVTRYFDTDELAYLHWGYNFYIGEKPYADFLFILPPGFLYLLYPLFALFGRSIAVLIEARVLMFLLFLATTLILMLTVKKLRGLPTALLTGIIFAFLPIPADKMLEIRPDLPAVFLAVSGIYLFIKRKYFLSGLCYAGSLAILPKTVFFLCPIALVFLYLIIKNESGKSLRLWILGFMLPLALTFGVIVSFGNFRLALYSMTQFALDSTKILAARFYMAAALFFYPNDTYYGLPGTNNLPYLLNLVIYVSALAFGVIRLISSLSYSNRERCLGEFLMAGSFYLNLYAFIYFFPLKHAQYLIMIAPFIAFYFADLVEAIHGSCHSLTSLLPSPIRRGDPRGEVLDSFGRLGILVFMAVIGIAAGRMYEKKLQWNNKAALEKITKLLAVVPRDERVFDLTGGSVFFRHGYYLCCLPYGQYEEAFRFPLPDLEKSIAENNTRYIYTDFYGRLDVLPIKQAKYIRESFVPSASWRIPDGSLLIRK